MERPRSLCFAVAVSRSGKSKMTLQGTAHGRFQRAIQRPASSAAEMAARELGGLNLAEALDLTLLLRETDRWRHERAAVRWLERLIEERRPTLAEIVLASAALSEGGRGRRWEPARPSSVCMTMAAALAWADLSRRAQPRFARTRRGPLGLRLISA
jgi:hypothetical protein